jgi:hypothetical protein
MGEGIFTTKNKEETSDFKEKVDNQTKAILTIIQRQKDLEENIDLLSQKNKLNSHSQENNFRKSFDNIKNLKEENLQLKLKVKKFEEFNSKLIKQLKLFSLKDETIKLEKYIDLWNPMNFLTRSELTKFKKEIKEDLKKIIEDFMK